MEGQGKHCEWLGWWLWEWLGEEVLKDTCTRRGMCWIAWVYFSTQAMSGQQLKAFMEAFKTDVGLQEKLKGAADLDAVVAIAKEA